MPAEPGPEGRPDAERRARLLEIEVRRLRSLVPRAAQRAPKLIIVDLNGLLLYRRMAKDKGSQPPPRPADRRAGAFDVWLRPHAASFLEFLLQRFHVAIWSSAQRQNITPLLELLSGGGTPLEQRCAFVWSQQECTDTGEKHPENRHRPLFLKDFARVFDAPAHAGLYTSTTTLLLDDDAYKARNNPSHTCICPAPYSGETEDQEVLGGLGPRAELRRWLGRLALADSVPAFVAGHPWPPTDAPAPSPAPEPAESPQRTYAAEDVRNPNRAGASSTVRLP